MLNLKYSFVLLASTIILHQANSAEFALNVNNYINQSEKLMPAGSTSFIELTSKGVFIDKTLFLGSLLKKPAGNRTIHSLKEKTDYLIIVSPHNWGKTMNLDMLKTFLEIQVHPNGSRILPLSGASNYQLFTQGKYHTKSIDIQLEKPLLISHPKYQSIIDDYLGQYPVIYLSFANISSSTEQNYTTILSKLFVDLFHTHRYMLNVYDHRIRQQSGNTDERREAEESKQEFLSYLQNTAKNLDKGLRFLSDQLRSHFNKKVFLLIDEYERLFYLKGLNLGVNFLTQTLRALGGSHDPIKTVFLTGITPEAYDAQNIMLHKFSYSPFPYYGFVREEMKVLYQYYRIPVEEQRRIKYWYGGFNTMKNAAYELYNPYSICNYINSRQLKPYWQDEKDHSVNLNVIFQTSEFLDVFITLITGKYYKIEYSMFSEKEWIEFNFRDVKQALNYLNIVGYLIMKSWRTLGHEASYTAHYRIPNYEIGIKLQTIFNTSNPLKPLDKTSIKWEIFLLSDSLTSLQLEGKIYRCFKYLAYEKSKESLVRVVVRLSTASEALHFINWRFIKDADNETVRPDIVLTSASRGIIIDINEGETGRAAMPLISRYISMFQRYPQIHDWKDIKLVFLTLIPDKCVQIASIIFPVNLNEVRKSAEQSKETFDSNITTLDPTTL